MTDVRAISVNSLVRRSDARLQDEAAVSALADSIAEAGLMNPLTVRPLADDRFEIIAGSHRFMACDMLEWTEIPCHVMALDDTRAELAMIDENLCRAELKGALRDQQTARRKVIYEALHPETKAYVAGAHGSNAIQGNAAAKLAPAFTTETAALTGQSERTIQRSAERGEKITPEAANLMAGTRLDTGSYADRIKDRPAAEQVETVRRDLATPPAPRQQLPQARLAPKLETGEAFTRFLALADDLEALGVRDILAAAGSQRSTLGQRASGLATMMDDILEGLADA